MTIREELEEKLRLTWVEMGVHDPDGNVLDAVLDAVLSVIERRQESSSGEAR